MTSFRINRFKWHTIDAAWEDRLKQACRLPLKLPTIAKSTGTVMFLTTTAKTPSWLFGSDTKGLTKVWHLEEKRSQITSFRIQ
jgi:hypothetical protein